MVATLRVARSRPIAAPPGEPGGFRRGRWQKPSSIAAVRPADEAPPRVTGGRSLGELLTLRVNPSVPMRLLPDFHPADAAARSASLPAAAPSDACSPAGARASRAWVPIRSLGPRHRERITAHLVALDERSRYLRFGYAANDAQI